MLSGRTEIKKIFENLPTELKGSQKEEKTKCNRNQAKENKKKKHIQQI